MDPAGVAPETIFRDPIDDEASPLHAPITWYRVEVQVRHARDGAILDVRVLRSSGMPSMDRAAIEGVREGARGVPPPPDDIRGSRPTFVSEWSFEVGDVATRWTQLAGVEDPVTGQVQAGALGRGVFRTSVVLLRVTDAEHPTFEERRMERRLEREAQAREERVRGLP
jgi:TonB family protein